MFKQNLFINFNVNKIFIPILAIIFIFLFLCSFKELISGLKVSEISKRFYYIKITGNFKYRFITNLLVKKKIVLTITFTLFFSTFFILFNNILIASIISTCLLIFFNDVLNNLKKGIGDLLNFQLIELINEMIIMLKAGKNIREIIRESSNRFDLPLAAILKDASNEIDMNIPISTIFENFLKKFNSTESKLFINTLKINQKIGGDLAYILNVISENIRMNLQNNSNLRTLTLQSKMSGYIISVFPIFLLILLSIFMKEEFRNFFNSPFGLIIVLIGGFFEILGIFTIRKIINYE